MSIRTKATLVVCIGFIALVIVVYAITTSILASSSRQLEAQHGRNSIECLRRILSRQFSDLDSLTAGLASMDDTYQFIRDGNEAYIDSHLSDESFAGLNLNLAVFVDPDGRPVYLKLFDLESGAEIEPPPDLGEHLAPGGLLLNHSRDTGPRSGLISLSGIPMTVASRPISEGDGEGSTRGTLIMGRYLDQSALNELITASYPLALRSVDDPAMSNGFLAARDSLLGGEPHVIQPVDECTSASYTLLHDVYGEPILIARLDTDRDAYQQGRVNLGQFTGLLLLVGLVVGAALLVVLDRLVLRRLEVLGDEVEQIRGVEDLSARVSPFGDDELGDLALAINGMLNTLEQSQQKLRESETLLRQVFETTPSLIYLKDSNGRYVLVNKAWTKFHDTSPDEALGKTDRELAQTGRLTLEEAQKTAANDRLVIESGQPQFIPDDRVTRRNVKPRWLQTVKVPLALEGEPHNVLGISIEITTQKQLEAQLLQSQKMESMGNLAAGLAHDLNNLLTVIIGNATLVLAKLPADSSARPSMEQILYGAESTSRLVRQLTLFGRRGHVELALVNLNHLLLEVARMLDRLLGEDIRFVTRLAPDLHMVEVDMGQVEQVLVNLAVNARDAMPQGGTLTVETANAAFGEADIRPLGDMPAGQYIVLSVSDTGEGMSAEVLPYIFEPFFSTKDAGKGSGLGLSTVYGIVKRHGGYIAVESVRGAGSTFGIYLPRSQTAAAIKGRGHDSTPLPEGNETILVVEDEPLVRETTVQILSGLGYIVLEAANGEEALRKVEAHDGRIELVLTDVIMPGMTGRDLADRLQETHPAVKVLFTSGHNAHTAVKDLVESDDSVAFLAKPLTVTSLAQKVRQVLDGG